MQRNSRTKLLQSAFEAAPEPATLTPAICQFNISNMAADEMIVARSRENVSSAMQFSKPAASEKGRSALCIMVRQFLLMHPSEGLTPIMLCKVDQSRRQFLADRAGEFTKYGEAPHLANELKSQLFSASCLTLAGVNCVGDDHRSHWVTATRSVPQH